MSKTTKEVGVSNPNALVFPTDTYGVLGNMPAAVSAAAARVNGNKEALDIFMAALRTLSLHAHSLYDDALVERKVAVKKAKVAREIAAKASEREAALRRKHLQNEIDALSATLAEAEARKKVADVAEGRA